ncbi:MAG TPA: hypothetical protein PKI59_02130 [Candidatus Cloacimonadota bacterium]|nr:hypothetical protein [Candidatus Cloacimonadota bacterium]
MLTNKSLLILTLLLIVSALSAWSITDSYFGNRYGALDARAFAMGSATAYNDFRPAAFTANPANLTLMKKQFGLQGTALINRSEDTRMLPLYNSFDNYIDDAVYASNINAFNSFAGSAFIAARIGCFGLGVGAYNKPMLSFDGKYREEIRNNRNTDDDGYPEKIAQNEINNEGSLDQTGLVLSMGLDLGQYSSINIGVDYSLLAGDVSQSKTIRWSDWAINTVGAYHLPEYTDLNEWELEGNQLKLGTSLRLNPRFGLAATYKMKTDLTRTGYMSHYREAYLNAGQDSTLTMIDDDYTLPSEYRLGFSYFPRNVMRTVFSMDVEMVRYSEVMDVFEDVYNFYAGVEHHVENRIPMRLGFQAVNQWFFTTANDIDSAGNDIVLYSTKKVLTPMITAGSAVQIMKNVVLDLGFGYSWREYEALDMFGDAYYNDKTYTGQSTYQLWPTSYINLQNRGWENPDKVKENFITLNAGISYSW